MKIWGRELSFKKIAVNGNAIPETETTKAFLRDNKAPNEVYQVDDFYTTLLNSIPISSLNTSRDLLLYLFNNVSEINALVTYVAQKGADIPRKHVRVLANGKEKDLGETDVLKLLKKPNFLNTGRTFMINCISSYLVHGFIPINKITPIGWQLPTELFLFPGNNFYPIPQQSVNQYGMPATAVDFRTNKIVKYRLFIDNKPFDFRPEEIVMINDSNLSFENGSYLTGQSRLYSAVRSIKILSSLYDTVLTLIADKGAAGFLTKRSKAGEVDSGWDEDDRKEVERRLYSYGTTGGKRPIGVTTKDLGFVRLSVPVSEFQPIELRDHEFRTLATALLFPSVLLNDKDGSIYNNVSLAQKAFYTDCLQPIVNLFYEVLSEGLGLTAINERLVADWSGIESLQSDRKLEAETIKLNDEVWKLRYENNLITLNDYLNAIGLPNLPNGNTFARDNKSTPLAVLIGVGGTQALQSILVDPLMTRDQKVNTLIIMFGLPKEDAEAMAGGETNTPPVNSQPKNTEQDGDG